MLVVGYIAAFFMGALLGLIGGGGSVLTVPILVYLMDIEPEVATGYSLLIVGATAALGAVKHIRQKTFALKSAIAFAIPSIIAVYVSRAYLMPNIPDTLFTPPFLIQKNAAIMLLFACLMLLSAAMMLRQSYSPKPVSAGCSSEQKPANLFVLIADGAVVGVLTGILGAGGGFLIIPALVLFLGMPMKSAVGASVFIIALKSLLGFLGDIKSGIELAMPLLPLMLAATFAGMSVSGRIANKLDEKTLQKIFAFFALTIAILIFIKELILD
jgi:uncharacterized membrane protein YfcA